MKKCADCKDWLPAYCAGIMTGDGEIRCFKCYGAFKKRRQTEVPKGQKTLFS